jgi:hypothetical protein
MKTLLKLVVMAAILFATYRIGFAYWEHYEFEDAVKQTAQFTDRDNVDELPNKVLDLAERMQIPLVYEQLKVKREPRRVTIDASYVRNIEVLPGVKRDWDFAIHVSVITLN